MLTTFASVNPARLLIDSPAPERMEAPITYAEHNFTKLGSTACMVPIEAVSRWYPAHLCTVCQPVVKHVVSWPPSSSPAFAPLSPHKSLPFTTLSLPLSTQDVIELLHHLARLHIPTTNSHQHFSGSSRPPATAHRYPGLFLASTLDIAALRLAIRLAIDPKRRTMADRSPTTSDRDATSDSHAHVV